jgi:hypothetical protein
MLNLSRIFAFWRRFLSVVIPLIMVALVFAVVTEALTHRDDLLGQMSTEGFWLAVGLNLLPFGIVAFLISWLVGRFLSSVYRLEGWKEGMGFLIHHRFGQSGFKPFLRIGEGKVRSTNNGVLTQAGGPGHLVIFNDSAVLLEQSGRFTRAEGPGFCKLEPFEKIYEIVDLRPKRWVLPVRAMTKEGIPVTWDVEVHYQIDDGGQDSTEKSPYPFAREAVFRAATSQWRREAGSDQDLDWEGRVVIGHAGGILRSILAQRPLDQLIGLTEADARAVRETVQEELEQQLRAAAPALGARVLQVKLDNLKVEDAITQQWIEAWKARWQRWSDVKLAQTEASGVYLYETAKAEAQMRMIVTITQALQKLDSSPAVTTRVILMRLFSALDRARVLPSSRVFVPGQALGALEKMRQLLGGDDKPVQ